jgi:hypothetical protein
MCDGQNKSSKACHHIDHRDYPAGTLRPEPQKKSCAITRDTSQGSRDGSDQE